MITVPEASAKIVKRSRYLSEAFSKGIINISSLARYIKPELEEILDKKVSYSSIIMALNRLSKQIKPQYKFRNIFKAQPDMIVRSNLIEVTVTHSENLIEKYPELLKLSTPNSKYFFTITKGIFETTIIASRDILKEINKILEKETTVIEFKNLSSITIKLPKEAIQTPGIFYFFLKSLAWEAVNIIEIVSTASEFTLILSEKDTNRAFAIIQSLFANEI